MKKIIIAIIVLALVGAGIYFGNTTLQKGSFSKKGSFGSTIDFALKSPQAIVNDAVNDVQFIVTFDYNKAKKQEIPFKISLGESDPDFSSINNTILLYDLKKKILNYSFLYPKQNLQSCKLYALKVELDSYNTVQEASEKNNDYITGGFIINSTNQVVSFAKGSPLPSDCVSVDSTSPPPTPSGPATCQSGTQWDTATQTCISIPAPSPPPSGTSSEPQSQNSSNSFSPPPPSSNGCVPPPTGCPSMLQMWDTNQCACIFLPPLPPGAQSCPPNMYWDLEKSACVLIPQQ